jgi:simple sugar transport system permease protein
VALLALVIYWFITSRTTFGYEIRVIGQNPKAAKYAGIPTGRNIIMVMALAGAVAGLAGAMRVMGQFPYQLIGSTFATDTTGFDAIGVALLGRATSVGMLLAALLFGGLRQGGTQMQLNANIPVDLVFIIQALVLFSIASEFLPALQKALPSWMSFSRRPALVPNIIGSTTVVRVPENGNNGSENGEPDTADEAPPEEHSDRVEEN